MFTGIVDHCGFVAEMTEKPRCCVLRIESQFTDLALGESIAVNGTCLTVTSFDPKSFTVDVSPETMRLTNLGTLAKGVKVNLERALRLSDRIGGHIVTGHVDQTARLEKTEQAGEYLGMTFSGVSAEFFPNVIKKGSICVNGVSLTLNAVHPTDGTFEVMLIPHTLERTNLQDLRVHSIVNLEFDWMTKVILSAVKERT
jgi:riboflavin synthase